MKAWITAARLFSPGKICLCVGDQFLANASRVIRYRLLKTLSGASAPPSVPG